MKPSQMKPLSYLESHTAELVKAVTESGEPVFITENGKARVVVLDAQAYEKQQQTLALLVILALGQKDIQTGNFVDGDAFFAELDNEDGCPST
jgi:prevent-host-death family protein